MCRLMEPVDWARVATPWNGNPATRRIWRRAALALEGSVVLDALDRKAPARRSVGAAKQATRPVLSQSSTDSSHDLPFVAGPMAQRVPFVVAELANRAKPGTTFR